MIEFKLQNERPKQANFYVAIYCFWDFWTWISLERYVAYEILKRHCNQEDENYQINIFSHFNTLHESIGGWPMETWRQPLQKKLTWRSSLGRLTTSKRHASRARRFSTEMKISKKAL